MITLLKRIGIGVLVAFVGIPLIWVMRWILIGAWTMSTGMAVSVMLTSLSVSIFTCIAAMAIEDES